MGDNARWVSRILCLQEAPPQLRQKSKLRSPNPCLQEFKYSIPPTGWRNALLFPLAPLPPAHRQAPRPPFFPRFSLLPDHLNSPGGWVCAPILHPSCQREVGPEWLKLNIDLSTHMWDACRIMCIFWWGKGGLNISDETEPGLAGTVLWTGHLPRCLISRLIN